MKKHLEVVAAILIHGGKILCMQRGEGKFAYVSRKFEFPGGKIEPGEAKHTALERELREEMDIHVTIKESDLYMTIHHEYPDFTLTMYCFKCYLDNPKFVRKEHIDSKWMLPKELHTLDWAPADLPITTKLAAEWDGI